MRTQAGVVVFCVALMAGCSGREDELQKQLAQEQSERAALQQTLAERDKYISDVMQVVNEVYADLEKARVKEAKLVERTGGQEGQIAAVDTRQKLLQNIGDIGSGLKESRKKISGLQVRVNSFKGEITGLSTLIDNLKQSLQEREQSVAQLEGRVQGLEQTVAEKTRALSEKETMIDRQQRKINTAFYVAGTRKELREKGIITSEGGFLWGLLGSTTVMASGVDPSMFTPIDKIAEHTIRVNGRIEEILPRRSGEFFATVQQEENNSALNIVSPEKFWQDNYLVVVLE